MIEKLKSRKVALDAAHDWLRGAEQLKLLKASKRASSRRAGAAHDPRCERGGIRGGAGVDRRPVLSHLRRDWAHPTHICAGTGLAPPTSAPGLGSPRPHLRRDWAAVVVTGDVDRDGRRSHEWMLRHGTLAMLAT